MAGIGRESLLLLLLLRAADDPTSTTLRSLDKTLEARFKLLEVRAQRVAAKPALGHGSYAWLSAVSALDEESFANVVDDLHRADILRFDSDDNFSFTHL